MFKLPERPARDARPLVYRRYFWNWFLTNAVFNLVDIENMAADMETNFKMCVLVFGRVLFFRDSDEKLRALWFKNAGEVPIYPGQIVRYMVTNPVIGEYTYSANQIGTDCVPMYLTMLDRCQCATGFWDLITTIAEDLAQNDISVNIAQYIKRLPVLFRAKTDTDKEAMVAILQGISDGIPEMVVQSPVSAMIDRMEGNQNTVAPLSEFTEYQQYKLGQFYSMLGVQSVFNMKRERVAAAENGVSEETARYNIADIIDNLNTQFDEVNSCFGTDFHARLNVERAREIANENTESKQEPDTENENPGGAENAESTD